MTDATQYRRERAEEKEQAITDIDEAIARIRDQGRDVDDWECADLTEAIGCVLRGMYRAASALAYRALTPEEQRSPTVKPQRLEGFNIDRLSKALDFVRNEPIIDYPIFGNIITRRAD
jgi:hypothetical protein